MCVCVCKGSRSNCSALENMTVLSSKKFQDTRFGSDFMDMAPKAQPKKSKSRQMGIY